MTGSLKVLNHALAIKSLDAFVSENKETMD